MISNLETEMGIGDSASLEIGKNIKMTEQVINKTRIYLIVTLQSKI